MTEFYVAVVVAAACAFGSVARAQTGVSDDRVSLPTGPGSLEGIGENAGVDGNMGAMTNSVPFAVPAGFPGMAPSLALAYSSGGGASVAGMGWSLDLPSIERMTCRGLPAYDLDDGFVVDGGAELVRVGASPPVYRARYEGGFVRYTWLAAGAGDGGYWKAEYPDGRVGYFGADASGTLVPSARVEDAPAGTFRYHLVELVDVFDHRMRVSYTKDGKTSLVDRIAWVGLTGAGGTARYSVTFGYEPRSDAGGADVVSDAKPGFEVRLTQRLAAVHVWSGANEIRSYELTYDPYDEAGGFTRLARVDQRGRDGGLYPEHAAFTYSQALGALCADATCAGPFMVDMGTTGVNFQAGKATFVDLDGDALPDLVKTPDTGNHEIFLSVPSADGTSAFAAGVTSAVGTNAFVMSSGRIQELDVDGDGFADLLNTKTGSYLHNDGSGDWGAVASLSMGDGLGLDFDADLDLSDEDGLASLRFFDYDNDKRIDILSSTPTTTTIYRNDGAGGFNVADGVEPIGAGFLESQSLELADMNGDGLLDIVNVLEGMLKVRLNYGWGHWGAWVELTNLPIALTSQNIDQLGLEDLNGDGLADLVLVTGTTVQYALNKSGAGFFSAHQLTSADVEGSLPERTGLTTVLYADMNGNGSTDIVWIGETGKTDYLELFPVRPNLLSTIENGLGKVTEVRYGTSVEHMARARATAPWAYRIPYPMIVVDELDTYDLLTNLHSVTRFTYADGYFDGAEKQFRGFAKVVRELVGDATQEGGVAVTTYDVGATDRYRKGLALTSSVESDGRALSTTTRTYEDCPLTGVPTTDPRVRYVCQTATETVLKEGLADSARWVTTRATSQYDGYGNVVLAGSLGVTAVGGAACASCGDREVSDFGEPCGAGCLGDESFTATDYVPPEQTGGVWMLGKPSRVRTYGRDGGLATETLTYYDGPAFSGLANGTLGGQGKVRRVTAKVADGQTVDVVRNDHDAHGNVIEVIDPDGSPSATTTHRRRYTFDAAGLRVTKVELLLEDASGAPYRLAQEIQYDPDFDKPVESTAWMKVTDQGQTARRSTFDAYDEHGRITAMVAPGGDTPESPTTTFSYELGSPASRVITRWRSTVGGPLDLEEVRCVDGQGRTYQTRSRLASGSYQVSGFSRFNVRGAVVEAFQPYLSASGACDAEPKAGTLATTARYDATYRLLLETEPDAASGLAASTRRTVYEPLRVLAYDAEDTDATSPHADTPGVTRVDGLGRVVALERRLAADGAPSIVTVHYDELGRMRGYADPQGHEATQDFDLVGRVTRIADPNSSGDQTFSYDAAGNVVSSTDGRGVVTMSAYDGQNRQVARWDASDRAGTEITTSYDAAPDCDPAKCTNTAGLPVERTYPLAGVQGAGAGVERTGYDIRGRVIYAARTLEGTTYETTTSYDNASRVTAKTYADGQVLDFTYDDGTRLRAVDGVIDAIDYDERGLTSRLALANGTTTSDTYDARMRLVGTTTKGPAGEVLQGFGYTLDRVGNVVAIADTATASTLGSQAATFAHDAWYRVLEAKLGGGAETLTHTFDALDNVLAVTSSVATSPANIGTLGYAGAGPNAVSEAGGAAFSYDAAGNLTERGDRQLSWDFLGRLRAVASDGGPLMQAAYGADERRVVKVERGDSVTHYVAQDHEVRDGISSVYVRIGRSRVARLESDALATAVYTDLAPTGGAGDGVIRANDAWLAWAAGEGLVTVDATSPSDPGRMLWSAARRLLLDDDGTRATFLAQDHLGSVTLATDADGEVVGQRAFYPTGLVREASGSVDPHGFTDQEADADTGLIDFGHRSLDAATGRWTAIDPLFARPSVATIGRLGESTTAYAYVGNAYASRFDPNGLSGRGSNGSKKPGFFKKLFSKREKKEEPDLDIRDLDSQYQQLPGHYQRLHPESGPYQRYIPDHYQRYVENHYQRYVPEFAQPGSDYQNRPASLQSDYQNAPRREPQYNNVDEVNSVLKQQSAIYNNVDEVKVVLEQQSATYNNLDEVNSALQQTPTYHNVTQVQALLQPRPQVYNNVSEVQALIQQPSSLSSRSSFGAFEFTIGTNYYD